MENKPLDTDIDDAIDETLDSVDESQDSELVGKEDVTPTPDVPDFKEKLEEISGREFKDEDDAIKHYKNLASHVGKPKVESAPAAQPESDNELSAIKDTVAKIQFLSENPKAKTYLEDLIVPMSIGKKLSLQEAWKAVQPLVQASEEQDKQKDIGVSSKNRTVPLENPAIQDLTKNAKQGSPAAREALIEQLIKDGQLG